MKNKVLSKLSVEFYKLILPITEDLIITKEFSIADQIKRSASSIGANISEAEFAESRKDLISKLSISRKEANETLFWLNLLNKNGKLNDEKYKKLKGKCNRIIYILSLSITTCKKNLSKNNRA